MIKKENKQLSLYATLYDKIPQNHILKLIDNVVDFNFINRLLESSYCMYYGRPAKEPEMMAKILILQYLYNLSDEQVIEDTRLNLAYMWFIGVNPEEDLPDPSLLSKFRIQRLKETSLDDIIKEVVIQCLDKGLIKGTGISVDCTHTEANTIKKIPQRIMNHLAKKILKNLKEENDVIPGQVNENIPNYKEIKDHIQSLETMNSYLEELVKSIKSEMDISTLTKTHDALKMAEEILKDLKFIQQKGIRSLIDKDARVGYKSKTDSFFGYKVEYAMIPEERIITAVNVHNVAYVDGTEYEGLYINTRKCGLNIKQAYGDKAYFRKPILDILKNDNVEVIIPVSESAYKIDESKFSYNKDSDQWFCSTGNNTVKKVRKREKREKRGNETLSYYFNKEV